MTFFIIMFFLFAALLLAQAALPKEKKPYISEECEHCTGTKLALMLEEEVEPPNYYVECKSCGAHGPKSGSENLSLLLWNVEQRNIRNRKAKP